MSKVSQIVNYQKGKPPKADAYSDNQVIYLSPEYLRGKEQPTFVAFHDGLQCVNDGDLILLWDGSNAGEFFMGKKGALSSTMVRLKFNQERFDKTFLFYQFKNIEPFLQAQTNGSGIPHVDKEVFGNVEVRDFKKPEQEYIASILNTADLSIEQTEKFIAKYQRIKTGLMQDLLTKGIDENGNIRSEKTHRFEIKNGIKVPVEWGVDVIDNLVTQVLDFKANGSFETLTANVKYYYEPNYARLIRLTDLRHQLKNSGVYIDEKGFKFLKKTRLVKGDILIACVGEYTGYVCQMPEVHYQATIAPNMFVVRFKSHCDNSFIAQYMMSDFFQNQILLVSTSSATKLLNNPNLRSLKIVLPPKKEQIVIADRLRSIEKRIETENEHIEKLKSIKTGLMQDLLSGKVRVNVNSKAEVLNG